VVELDEWSGLVDGRSDDFDGLHVVAVVETGNSFSGPVRVIASDDQEYFVKSLGGCPPGYEEMVVVEWIVAQVGLLIKAPVCTTSLIRVTKEISDFSPQAGLDAGLGYASLALRQAEEHKPNLTARRNDDNARRHVGAYALYDWCWGFDEQWLYDLSDDRALYSHDHGLYLPPVEEGGWSRDALIAVVNEPHQLTDPSAGLSIAAVEEVATALETVQRAELVAVLRSTPASWPVTDDELETLGWFLERRAPSVASRLRCLTISGEEEK
jgi:hypothetical protein